jgi:hypothetical protein
MSTIPRQYLGQFLDVADEVEGLALRVLSEPVGAKEFGTLFFDLRARLHARALALDGPTDGKLVAEIVTVKRSCDDLLIWADRNRKYKAVPQSEADTRESSLEPLVTKFHSARRDLDDYHSPAVPEAVQPKIQVSPPDHKALAMALLFTVGPNAKAISDKIGVPRTTLLGWPDFKAAYDKVKADKQATTESRRRRLRKGDEDNDDEE